MPNKHIKIANKCGQTPFICKMPIGKTNTSLYLIYGLFVALAFVLPSTSQAESKGTSYVDNSKPFITINNVNRESEAWAMCAATYDLMAELFVKDQPARAKQFSELANGAELAIAMSIITDGFVKDIKPERFNALLNVAKTASTELPKTRRTMLLAELESSTSNKKNDGGNFMSNLSATFEVCVRNLESQQMYIDNWRELAKSGLLKLPSDE